MTPRREPQMSAFPQSADGVSRIPSPCGAGHHWSSFSVLFALLEQAMSFRRRSVDAELPFIQVSFIDTRRAGLEVDSPMDRRVCDSRSAGRVIKIATQPNPIATRPIIRRRARTRNLGYLCIGGDSAQKPRRRESSAPDSSRSSLPSEPTG